MNPAVFYWRRALWWGLVYWAFYGAVEYALADAVSEWLRPEGTVPYPEYWLAGVEALLVWLVCGPLLSAAGAGIWFLAGQPRNAEEAEARMTRSAGLTVLLVFGYVLARRSQGLVPTVLALAVPAGLIAAGLVAGWSARWSRWTWFLMNPVTLTVAVLLRPWMYFYVLPKGNALVQISFSSLAFLAVLALSWLLFRGKPAGWGSRFAVTASVWIVAAAVVLGFGLRARVSLPGPPAEGAQAGRPNVILITLDTVRADHLHLYGYPRQTTPQLEEFARQATVYSGAISAADWTAPSHATMMTGLYALRHGVRYDYPDVRLGHIPQSAPTLAETLQHYGYRTAAIVANKAYLAPEIGFGRGFDLYRVPTTPVSLETSRMPSVLRSTRLHLMGISGADTPYVPGAKIADEVGKLLPKWKRGRPEFLFLNLMDAHWPYNPPPPFKNRFMTPTKDRTSAEFYEIVKLVDQEKRVVTPQEREELVAAYDSGIAYVDHELGRLFQMLRANGLFDNSLIIVSADHGEVFGERSLMEHGVSVYQDQVHVPLIVKYPGQKARQDVAVTVSLVDLFPTVLDVLGAPVPRRLAGITLRKADKLAARPVYAESYALWQKWGVEERFIDVERAVYLGGLKMVLTTKGRRELYDLAADPNETRDVQGSKPEQAAQLERLLRTWQQNYIKPGDQELGMGQEAVDRLKSLGYVQ
ncbi:sulfatase [Paludibaculum fermentans]|uniref:Sulfatase-like hydrolase/transferase n=1 Tax=Paludibaculum fermentans TaxID=1473598 RepID=A0A7S7NJY2_PALFE|nr:sulfatase-like hydrolase/transferase [Paludibaculum fermentans]QOY84987.1 sulfatase-like hydrolase/transferase [Paludibaculum fermentans]